MMVYALLIYSNNILYSVNFLEDMYIITGNLTWFLTFLELLLCENVENIYMTASFHQRGMFVL
jgi:hypothetical protein